MISIWHRSEGKGDADKLAERKEAERKKYGRIEKEWRYKPSAVGAPSPRPRATDE